MNIKSQVCRPTLTAVRVGRQCWPICQGLQFSYTRRHTPVDSPVSDDTTAPHTLAIPTSQRL